MARRPENSVARSAGIGDDYSEPKVRRPVDTSRVRLGLRFSGSFRKGKNWTASKSARSNVVSGSRVVEEVVETLPYNSTVLDIVPSRQCWILQPLQMWLLFSYLDVKVDHIF